MKIKINYGLQKVLLFQVVVIRLLDFPMMKKKGTHIKLKADCFLPYINFDDVSYIFQEAVFLTYDILNEVSFD